VSYVTEPSLRTDPLRSGHEQAPDCLDQLSSLSELTLELSSAVGIQHNRGSVVGVDAMDFDLDGASPYSGVTLGQTPRGRAIDAHAVRGKILLSLRHSLRLTFALRSI
jgi:hypothetical protein